MLYWIICGILAVVRLLTVYLTQKVPAGKDRPRVIPWRSVALTLSVLWTCAMMGYVNVGGVVAAAVYGVLVMLMFVAETPAPRAIFMLFVIAAACRIDIHTVLVCFAAGIPDISIAISSLSVFNK